VRSAGHAFPPLLAGETTVKVCVWVPPPHVALQVDQADQEPTQSLGGQACVLHVCDWVVTVGQAVPPLAAGVTTFKVLI